MNGERIGDRDENQIKFEMVESLLKEMTPEMEMMVRKELEASCEERFEAEVQKLRDQARQTCEQLVEQKIDSFSNESMSRQKVRKANLEQREKQLIAMKESLMIELSEEISEQCEERLKAEINKRVRKQTGLHKDLRERLLQEMRCGIPQEVQRKELLLKLNYKRRLEEEKEQLQVKHAAEVEASTAKQIADIEALRAETAKAITVSQQKIQLCKDDKKYLLSEKEEKERELQAFVEQLQEELKRVKSEALRLQETAESIEKERLVKQQQQQLSRSRRDSAASAKQLKEQQQLQRARSISNEKNEPENATEMHQTATTTETLLAKSPFHLSMSNKLSALALTQDKSQIHKGIVGGIDLFAPPEALFLPPGVPFIQKQLQQNATVSSECGETKAKFQFLKEYNTAALADKVLQRIQQNQQHAKTTGQWLHGTPSQHFSQLFAQEIKQGTRRQLEEVSFLDDQKQEIEAEEEVIAVNSSNCRSRLNGGDIVTAQETGDEQENTRRTQAKEETTRISEGGNSRYDQALNENLRFQLIAKEKRRVQRSQVDQSQRERQLQSHLQPKQTSKYWQVFLVSESDNQKVKKMKLRHQRVSEILANEEALEARARKFQERLFEEFIPTINCSSEQERDVEKELQRVVKLWDDKRINMEGRCAFLEELINGSKALSDVKSKLRFEREYLESQQCSWLDESVERLLEQRQAMKREIDMTSEYKFSFRNNKRFYQTIKNIDQGIEQTLARLGTKRLSYSWKGVSVEELILLDAFEEDILQKEEFKEEITKKVVKKF